MGDFWYFRSLCRLQTAFCPLKQKPQHLAFYGVGWAIGSLMNYVYRYTAICAQLHCHSILSLLISGIIMTSTNSRQKLLFVFLWPSVHMGVLFLSSDGHLQFRMTWAINICKALPVLVSPRLSSAATEGGIVKQEFIALTPACNQRSSHSWVLMSNQTSRTDIMWIRSLLSTAALVSRTVYWFELHWNCRIVRQLVACGFYCGSLLCLTM